MPPAPWIRQCHWRHISFNVLLSWNCSVTTAKRQVLNKSCKINQNVSKHKRSLFAAKIIDRPIGWDALKSPENVFEVQCKLYWYRCFEMCLVFRWHRPVASLSRRCYTVLVNAEVSHQQNQQIVRCASKHRMWPITDTLFCCTARYIVIEILQVAQQWQRDRESSATLRGGSIWGQILVWRVTLISRRYLWTVR